MMQQLSLLEVKPLMLPEQVESRQKEIQVLRKVYKKQRDIALSADGRAAYNAAVMANGLKMEIERLEREAVQ